MKNIILLCVCLFVSSFSYSQISGKVIDEDKQPIEFCSIQLLSLPDSVFIAGAVSDNLGEFRFNGAIHVDIVLKISCVGYETVCVSNPKVNLGVVQLTPLTAQLKGVTITAQKPRYALRGGSLITSVRNSILSTIGTATDVLKQIPGVWASGDKLEVFGKGSPTIYINGRVMRNPGELQLLKSDDIESVELVMNPGAEYDANTNAVLNIKTVRRQGDGLSGRLETGGVWMEGWDYGGEVNLNYRKKRLDVFGSVNTLHGDGMTGDGTTNIKVFTKPVWETRSQGSIYRSTLHNWSGRVGFNYDFNKKHSVGMSYNLSAALPKSEQSSYSEKFEDDVRADIVETTAETSSNSKTHHFNTYYSGSLTRKLKLNLDLDLVASGSEKNGYTDEYSQEEGKRTVTTWTDADNKLYASKLVMIYRLKKGKLSFGVEYTNIHRTNLSTNEEHVIDNDNTETKEQKASGFVSYDLSVGKAYLQAGLRYEHTETDYYREKKLLDEKSTVYNDWYPNAALSLPVKKINMSVAYSLRTSHPSFSQLDGSIRYLDRYMYSRGNPMLKPQMKHDVTYQAIYKFMRLSATYQCVKNYIMQTREIYEENPAVTMVGYTNLNKHQKLNLSFSASPKIGCWQPMFHLNYGQQFFKASIPDGYMNFDAPIYYAGLSNQITLPGSVILSADIDYMSEGDNGVRQIGEKWGVDLGLRRSFMKKALWVNLRIQDVFKTRENFFKQYSVTTIQESWSKWNTRAIILTLSYTFNKTKSKYKGKGAAMDDLQRLD